MRIPQLRRHKGVGQAYVRIDGRQEYLGAWPATFKEAPAAVQEAYRKRVGELLKGHVPARPKVSRSPAVAELVDAYVAHAEGYYVKRGRATSEVHCIRSAVAIVARLYPFLAAADFGLAELREVRDEMVRAEWTRKTVNRQVARVRGMFRWAAEELKVPAEVATALDLMKPLKKGRTTAPDRPPVGPVCCRLVKRSLPHLHPVVSAMVQVHYLLGCRSQDVVILRPCDLDRSGPVWAYTPPTWKTEHHEDARPLVYHVGPVAQKILAPLLEACKTPESYAFPVTGLRGASLRSKGCYTTGSYRRAVQREVERAGLPRWCPLQLRHTRLTHVRQRFGAEAAMTVAQHAELSTTEIYAEKNLAAARKIMGEIG